MEKVPKIEELNILKEIKLSDYERERLEGDVAEWLRAQEIPGVLWDRIKQQNSELTVKKLLENIRDELLSIYGKKRDKAKSFADSRFTPLPEMIDRGMVSCGSMANIFGNVLRKLGIPTKFIHGKLERQKEAGDRHSWLEIYNPHNGTWIEIDSTGKNFEMAPDALRYKIYHDWQELKEDFDKGDY